MARQRVPRIESREYQERALRALPRLLKKHRRVVAVSPTGSGKTVIGARLIQKMRAKRVIWLAHRIELLRQAYRELVAAGIPESDLGIVSGIEQVNPEARILIASVGMFRGKRVPKADLIVVDEAHRVMASSYRRILRSSSKVLVNSHLGTRYPAGVFIANEPARPRAICTMSLEAWFGYPMSQSCAG